MKSGCCKSEAFQLRSGDFDCETCDDYCSRSEPVTARIEWPTDEEITKAWLSWFRGAEGPRYAMDAWEACARWLRVRMKGK
jgi:hypothetical protein